MILYFPKNSSKGFDIKKFLFGFFSEGEPRDSSCERILFLFTRDLPHFFPFLLGCNMNFYEKTTIFRNNPQLRYSVKEQNPLLNDFDTMLFERFQAMIKLP